MKSALAFAALCLAQGAFAHYRWTNLYANGSTTADYYYVRQNTNYNSPVTDVTSNDIRCNTGTQAAAANTHIGTVTAGSEVGLALDQAIYHPGIATLYMTKVANDNTADGSTPWFKVAQLLPTFGPNTVNWPANNLQKYTVTIPKSLPSGQYLLRAEHIALHVAQSADLMRPDKATDPGILININYPVPTSYVAPGPSVWTG
ncbi:MAG: hypothetical protein Q9227_003418 [Pyrenula ochraceoflavens]